MQPINPSIMPSQTAIEQRKTLLKDMTALQLAYVAHVTGHEDKAFIDVFNQRTELYSYSEFYLKDVPAETNSAWQNIVRHLYEIWREHGDKALADSAWFVLQKHFEPRIVPDLIQAQKYLASSFAGFTYEFHCEYFGPAQPDLLTLHFRNYFAPDSPFHHRPELINALLQISDEVQKKRPDITRVQCASWLNNLPPFYEIFPRAWFETSTVCPIEGHNGWWGQFVDRYGQLHEKNAARFEQTKTFLYPNRHCRCDMLQLKKHLWRMTS